MIGLVNIESVPASLKKTLKIKKKSSLVETGVTKHADLGQASRKATRGGVNRRWRRWRRRRRRQGRRIGGTPVVSVLLRRRGEAQ